MHREAKRLDLVGAGQESEHSSHHAYKATLSSFKASHWADRLLERYCDLNRERLQGEARKLRQKFAAHVGPPRRVNIHSLPWGAVELLRHLDVTDPYRTLGWSLSISDYAMREAASLVNDPLHMTGLMGALVERELWELPCSGGRIVQNLALAKLAGVYFTPPNVAWYITVRTMAPFLTEALECRDPKRMIAAARIKVLDPGCGAGIFLVAALQVLLSFYDTACELHPTVKAKLGPRKAFAKRVVQSQLFGIDISRRLCSVTRRALAEAVGCDEATVSGVVYGNSLTGKDPEYDKGIIPSVFPRENFPSIDWRSFLPEGKVDVALLNPPFGRLRALQSELAEKSRALRLKTAEEQRMLRLRRSYFDGLCKYFRSVKCYRMALGGVLDWQRIFLCRALSALDTNGRIGAIMPVSIVADRSAKALRHYLFENTSLERIDRLMETAKLFPGVNQPTCILVATKGSYSTSFITSRPSRSLASSSSEEFRVNILTIRRLSPETLAIPAADAAGWKVLEKLYISPRLRTDRRISNLRGEFDLTVYRKFIGGGKTRLVRGDHIERFRHRAPEHCVREGYIDATGFAAALRGSAKVTHITRLRLVGRQCAFLEKNRRLSFTIVGPGVVVANSCNYLLWEDAGETNGLLLLAGLLNSALIEWRFRLTSSNNHVNNYEIDDLPIPQTDPRPIIRVAKRLLEYYANLPFGASAEAQGKLEDALDAAVFRAYHLDTDDVYRIMSEVDPHRAANVSGLMGR